MRIPRVSRGVAQSLGESPRVSTHRHRTPLRGVKAIPHPREGNPNYQAVNYEYAGKVGHVHEVVTIGGRELAKVGFDDKKIVYYLLEDLELEEKATRGTFHDQEPGENSPDG
jgi:hypothetical protein